MAADRQRKVKLLAIEEEIARLEVEMLIQIRDGPLGPSFSLPDFFGTNLKEDIIRFFNYYLQPIQDMAGIQFLLESNVDVVLGKFLDKGSVVPGAIWIVMVKNMPIYVFFMAVGENSFYYIVSQASMGGVSFRKEDFTNIWSSRSTKDNTVSLAMKQTELKKKIDLAASAALAAGGNRKPSKKDTTPALPRNAGSPSKGATNGINEQRLDPGPDPKPTQGTAASKMAQLVRSVSPPRGKR